MCTKLGGNLKLNNPNFSFPHTTSGEPIYLFYDPCPMVKLICNTLDDRRILINSQGEKIEWEYIKKLYLKEKKEGLKVATKLTQKHVYHVTVVRMEGVRNDVTTELLYIDFNAIF